MSQSAGVPWQESSACTQQTKKSLHSRECWKNALSRSMRYFSWWKHENTKWWFLVIPHKCDRDHTNHSPKISLVLFVVTVLPGSLNRTDSDFSEPKTFGAWDFQGTGLASSESHAYCSSWTEPFTDSILNTVPGFFSLTAPAKFPTWSNMST